MNMRKLRYFSVLAEEKHFGRAAARLSLSQPPLSLAIQQLESEIGAKLFERDSRNVSLTRAGEALQQEAIFLLRRAEEARLLVKAISEGKGGRLRIGFSGSMLYRGLPNIISAFKTVSPTTELLLRELNTVEQVAAFGRDEIDLGLHIRSHNPGGARGFSLSLGAVRRLPSEWTQIRLGKTKQPLKTGERGVCFLRSQHISGLSSIHRCGLPFRRLRPEDQA